KPVPDDDYEDELEYDPEEEDWGGEDGDPYDFDELSSIPFPTVRSSPPRKNKPRTINKKPVPPAWKKQLTALRQAAEQQATSPPRIGWSGGREILYILDVPLTMAGNGLAVEINQRERKQNGQWSKPRLCRLSLHQLQSFPEPLDQQILALMNGS